MAEDQDIPEEKIEKENPVPDQQAGKSEEASENISQEQTIEQPETTNPKSEIQTSEIENMEVHHHPDLHHRKKHWKEYFLEFLMIFLAVTLGFFAESYREHLGDRSKEKEYMHSMVTDLQKDVAGMNKQILALNYQVNGHNTLEYMLENPLNNAEYYRKLYYYEYCVHVG